MFKNFLTLKALRRSLVELSRSPVVHMDAVASQLEKTRNTILLIENKDTRTIDFLILQICKLELEKDQLKSDILTLQAKKIALITENDDEDEE